MKKLLIVMFTLVALAGTARSDGPAEHRHTVVVPYDVTKAPEEQQADRYYLDYETFQRLWSRAKDKRRTDVEGEKPAGVAQDFALTNALYRATLEQERVLIEGRLTLVTRGRDWQKVPLAFDGGSISELTLDGSPAAYEGGAILVEASGAHEITVRFEVPFVEGRASKGKGEVSAPASWGIPHAAASMLAVTMSATDSEDAEPVINDGAPMVESDGVFTVALGQGQRVTLDRRLRTRGRGMAQPSVARIDAHLFIAPGLERLEASYDLSFRGQEESSFSISFDASLTPIHFEIPNLASWRLIDDEASGLRRLNFELTQAASDGLQVRLVAERLVDASGERSFPRLAASALRLEQRLSLLRGGELAVRVLPGATHRQLEFVPNVIDQAGFAPVATYGLSGAAGDAQALRYALQARTGGRSAKVDYVYQVATDKVETVAQLQIKSPTSALAEMTIGLPAGSTVQSVRGNRLQEWWRSGDELFVRFSGATPEVTALLVYVARELEGDAAGAEQRVTLAPMSLPEIDEVSGNGLVVAHATVDTTLRFDKGREIVREVDESSVANDFAVLEPLQRKRGYEFFAADVAATLTLRPVAPRYDVTWVMMAQTFESWVKLSAQVDVAVSQSAIDRLNFALPEDLPEVRVVSPEIREVRSGVSDGQRIYTVVFQRYVTDAIDFIIEAEVPQGGALTLSGLAFAGATREERFVIVDNGSSDRLQVETRGMERTVAELLPFTPESLGSAQLFRAREDWAVDLRIEELETTAGNDAVVLWSELKSAFRANGEEWLKVVYHLQNRSLQFMPVVLPEGAELVSVLVSGESTRADRGLAPDGREAVLVPLIQTRPGQLAYDVELVLRSRQRVRDDGRAVRKLVRDLDDPDVVGMMVQRTLWHVSLPEGFTLRDFDGNLEPVDKAELALEKAESDLAELESLNQIGADSKFGNYGRALGVSNGGVLSARVEEALSSLGGTDDEQVAQRERELRERWAGQKIVLTENRIQMPQFESEAKSNADGEMGRLKDAGRGGAVDWNFNETRLMKRNNDLAVAEEKQLEQLNSQMQLNDNIAVGNQYFNSVQSAAIDANGGVVVVSDKAKKADADASDQIGKLSGGKGGEVAQKLEQLAYAQLGHGGVESGTAGAFDAPGANAGQQVSGNADGFIDLAPNAAPSSGMATIEGAQSGNRNANLNDFDNARSQLLTRRGSLKASAEMAVADAASAAGTTPMDPFDDPVQTGKPVGGFGLDAPVPTGQLATEPALKATGRRSVVVEFPEAGTVYHFKKVKDHARLGFVATESRDLRQMGWLLAFALIFGAVLAADAGIRLTRRARS